MSINDDTLHVSNLIQNAKDNNGAVYERLRYLANENVSLQKDNQALRNLNQELSMQVANTKSIHRDELRSKLYKMIDKITSGEL